MVGCTTGKSSARPLITNIDSSCRIACGDETTPTIVACRELREGSPCDFLAGHDAPYMCEGECEYGKDGITLICCPKVQDHIPTSTR